MKSSNLNGLDTLEARLQKLRAVQYENSGQRNSAVLVVEPADIVELSGQVAAPAESPVELPGQVPAPPAEPQIPAAEAEANEPDGWTAEEAEFAYLSPDELMVLELDGVQLPPRIRKRLGGSSFLYWW